MKDENASSPSLAEGKNQEVFITDAERIKAIKSALWDIVELYDDAKLSSSERRAKCIDRIGEIEIHKRANSELFTDREVEFLEKVQMEDSTLMHTSFHAAALHGIFDSDDRNSQAWNISIIRGKLAYFEDLSEMIDVYVENPSFTNLMRVVSIVSGYCFSRCENPENLDPRLKELTSRTYNAIITLINGQSIKDIIEVLQRIQGVIESDARTLKAVFSPAS